MRTRARPGPDEPRPGLIRLVRRPLLPPAQARLAVFGVLALQVTANGIGALVVVVYLRLLFPVAVPDGGAALGINLVAFGAYLFVTMVLALPVNAVLLSRAVRWVREDRAPTRAERLKVLALPMAETVSAFAGWIGGAVMFGIINQDSQRAAVGIALAGLVTCSLLFLLLDRHFRPIRALALVGTELPVRREILPRIMIPWIAASAVPLLGLGAAAINVPPEELADLGTRIAVATGLSVAAGGLVMRAAASAIALPVQEVRAAMARVEEGDLDVEVRVTNIGELGRLQAGFNRMVEGLRERAHLRDLLGRAVGGEVAERQLRSGGRMHAELREVSVLFIDLEGFTTFAETHDPTEVIAELNAFFAVVVDAVMAEGGLVNKFEGDAAVCVFGAPADQPDHAARALRVAAALPEAVAAAVPVAAGVGVATGKAVAGNLGTLERYEYTVVGDIVNLAARLADEAKAEPARVLVTAATVDAAGPAAGDAWARLGSRPVRGRSAPAEVATLRAGEPAGGSAADQPRSADAHS